MRKASRGGTGTGAQGWNSERTRRVELAAGACLFGEARFRRVLAAEKKNPAGLEPRGEIRPGRKGNGLACEFGGQQVLARVSLRACHSSGNRFVSLRKSLN